MAWFKCFIHGQDFPGRLLGKRGTVGFYTTRVVQAKTPKDAELKAVQLLKRHHSLKVSRIFKTGKAKVFFESVDEIPDHHHLLRRRPQGLMFYANRI
jgi:hypothetical protein